MRILLTGSTGFVGEALLKLLNDDGSHEIFSVSLRPESSADLILENVFAESRLREGIRFFQPEVVLHLTGLMHGESYEDFYRLNCCYAHSLLNSVRDVGCDPRVIVFGSAAEYGLPGAGVRCPEAMVGNPTGNYGLTKLIQTEVCETFRQNGMRTLVLRVFNILGHGISDKFLVGKVTSYLRQVQEGVVDPSSATLHTGCLGGTRDFLDLETVCGIVRDLIRLPDHMIGVLNVCSGRPLKMRDLVESAFNVANVPLRFLEEKKRPRELAERDWVVGNNQKLITQLGYQPDIDLEKALHKSIFGAKRSDMETCRIQ